MTTPEKKNPRDLSERLLDFSAQVIRLLDELPEKSAAQKISDQLLRSAMSVGANYEEAKGTDSRGFVPFWLSRWRRFEVKPRLLSDRLKTKCENLKSKVQK